MILCEECFEKEIDGSLNPAIYEIDGKWICQRCKNDLDGGTDKTTVTVNIRKLRPSSGMACDCVFIDGAVIPDIIILGSGIAKDVIEKIYQAGRDGKELELIEGSDVYDEAGKRWRGV